MPSSRQCLAKGSTSNACTAPAGVRTCCALEVDDEMHAGRARDLLQQPVDDILREHHRQEAVLQRVRREDVAERRRDRDAKAVVVQRPYRVLARRPATEVAVGDHDAGRAVRGLIEQEVRLLAAVRQVAQVAEEVRAEIVGARLLQVARRDDLVGVDVGPGDGQRDGIEAGEAFHGGQRSSVRTSVRRPVTAAAAAIAGLMRCVRDPGPCRPWKLRFDVDAQRSPGATRSPLVARHIEQPAKRHSNPASREDPVQSLGFGLRLHAARPRDHPRLDPRRHATAGHHRRRRPQVLDARVGARSDEHAVDRDFGQRRAGGEAHVGQRALPSRRAARRRCTSPGSGTRPVIGSASSGLLPQVTIGSRRATSSVTSRSNVASSSVRSVSPVAQRAFPRRPRRRERPAVQIGERGVVGRDHARARAGLDRHVAQREAPFHRQRAHRRPGVLDRVTGRTRGPDLRDDREDDVLRGHARGEFAVDRDAQRLRPLLPDRLRGEHVRHFRRADAERQRAERAVRRRMAVAAHDEHPRLRQALLRSRSRG